MTVNIVIAWRIMVMNLLGSDVTKLPPEVSFSDLESKVLKAHAEKNLNHQDCLGDMVILAAPKQG